MHQCTTNSTLLDLPQQTKPIVFEVETGSFVLKCLFVVEDAFAAGSVFENKISSLEDKSWNHPVDLASLIGQRLATIANGNRFRFGRLLSGKQWHGRTTIGAERREIFTGERSNVPIEFDNNPIPCVAVILKKRKTRNE